MTKRYVRVRTEPTDYEVRPDGDGYDVVRADPVLTGRSRRAGTLKFVIQVVGSNLRDLVKELKLKLRQLKEWFEMEPPRNGSIEFTGTMAVLEFLEDLGYRAQRI